MQAYGISIIGNSFINNGIAFSSSVPELLSYTIEENTINGKNIYFYKNDNDVLVPSDAGQIFLVQCTDFTLQDLTISNVRTGYNRIGGGICLINSSRITIQGCHISSCSPVGMYMVNSDHNTIVSNNLSIFITGSIASIQQEISFQITSFKKVVTKAFIFVILQEIQLKKIPSHSSLFVCILTFLVVIYSIKTSL